MSRPNRQVDARLGLNRALVVVHSPKQSPLPPFPKLVQNCLIFKGPAAFATGPNPTQVTLCGETTPEIWSCPRAQPQTPDDARRVWPSSPSAATRHPPLSDTCLGPRAFESCRTTAYH